VFARHEGFLGNLPSLSAGHVSEHYRRFGARQNFGWLANALHDLQRLYRQGEASIVDPAIERLAGRKANSRAIPATSGPSGLASLAPFLSYAPILRTEAAVMLFPSFATSGGHR
jgi:hypothetical protein